MEARSGGQLGRARWQSRSIVFNPRNMGDEGVGTEVHSTGAGLRKNAVNQDSGVSFMRLEERTSREAEDARRQSVFRRGRVAEWRRLRKR